MNKAVAKVEPDTESTAIINVIERAAINPAVDIDKMERLLEMQERIMDRNAKAAYIQALADMQQELPVIAERGGIKDRSGRVQSKYALWEDINETIKPILGKHGFALSFRTGRDGEFTVVTGVLGHRGGHSEETSIHLPADTSGSKNSVQAVGSSTSYGKRYTAQALLNLTSGGEDDDGEGAGGNTFITADQLADIRQQLDGLGADIPAFCRYLNVNALSEIRGSQLIAAQNAIAAKRNKGGAK